MLTILTFSGQVSRQCVNISIAMDGIVEPAESFNVVLATPDPAVVLGTSTAQVLIADSDSEWTFLLVIFYSPKSILWVCKLMHIIFMHLSSLITESKLYSGDHLPGAIYLLRSRG